MSEVDKRCSYLAFLDPARHVLQKVTLRQFHTHTKNAENTDQYLT